jgi:predicted O-methyltransferase YrrM
MSKSICANGAAKMGRIIERATGDIKHRLWTLYWLTRLLKSNGIVVELGTREGDSTRAILAACEDCASDLYSFDIADVCAVVQNTTAQLGFGWFDANWIFTMKDSIKAGMDWSLPQADLIFVDSDHSFEVTRAEIVMWHKHVRPGGVMVFHDYWLVRDDCGVKFAVDDFANNNPEKWRLETHDAYGDTGLALLWRNI